MKFNNFLKSSILCAATVAMSGVSLASGALYKFNGKEYNEATLPQNLKQAIYDLEFERHKNLQMIIDNAILDEHINTLASQQKKEPSKVAEELFKASEPTEAEMKAWFEKEKERIPYPYDKIKGEIAKLLQNEKAQAKRTKVLEDIKKKGGFTFLAKAPEAPVVTIDTAGFPVKGNKDAKVTIVEFADYSCPHCKESSILMKDVMAKLGQKVKLVYIDFPRNPVSKKVSEGSVCADEQGKYWEYQEMAFANQKELSEASATTFANNLKLDIKKFETCLASDATKKKIQKGQDIGSSIGVMGTPTFFVNGKKMNEHAHSVKDWEAVVKPYL